MQHNDLDADDRAYIKLDSSSSEVFPERFSNLKILTKLFDASCNVGTEGRLNTFLAVTLDKEENQFVTLADVINEEGTIKVTDKRLVLLNIFIPEHEDMVLELVSMLPAVEMEAAAIIQDIMMTLKEMYLKACVIESTEGLLQ